MRRNNVTVHDIAKKLGISPSTVSRALNNHPKISSETKSRVKEVALSMGYALTVSNTLKREILGNTVGIIVPSLESAKYASMVESCRKELEQAGYQPIILCSSDQPEQEEKIINLLENIDAFGIVASISNNDASKEVFKKISEKKPTILFDNIDFDLNCGVVMIDHFQAGYRSVKHLIHSGCKKIAHFGGDYDNLLTKQISVGYKTALRNAGISNEVDLEYFSKSLTQDMPAMLERLLSKECFIDAILVDDITAAQKLSSIIEARNIKVTDKLSIVAIGEEREYSMYSSSLTTVQLPYSTMGTNAAKMLIARINKKDTSTRTEIIPFKLNVRNSSLRMI